MHWLIQSWRLVLLWGSWPDWSMFLRFLVVAVVVFFAGADGKLGRPVLRR